MHILRIVTIEVFLVNLRHPLSFRRVEALSGFLGERHFALDHGGGRHRSRRKPSYGDDPIALPFVFVMEASQVDGPRPILLPLPLGGRWLRRNLHSLHHGVLKGQFEDVDDALRVGGMLELRCLLPSSASFYNARLLLE